MNNRLSAKRLTISIREFWELNKLKLLSVPVVIILCYIAYFMMPQRYLNVAMLYPEMLANNESVRYIFSQDNLGSRVAILVLIPIFILICSQAYLNSLNKSVRVTLVPISRIERILTLYIYNIGILITAIVIFSLLDWALISHIKNTYFDQVTAVDIDNGYLYKKYKFGSYFVLIEHKMLLAASAITIALLPFYHLSLVLFKKNSFIWSCLLYILIFCASLYIIIKYHTSSGVSGFVLDNMMTRITTFICFAFVYYLLVASFYYKLKERQL